MIACPPRPEDEPRDLRRGLCLEQSRHGPVELFSPKLPPFQSPLVGKASVLQFPPDLRMLDRGVHFLLHRSPIRQNRVRPLFGLLYAHDREDRPVPEAYFRP